MMGLSHEAFVDDRYPQPGVWNVTGTEHLRGSFARRGRPTAYRICTSCIMDTSDPGISFDADGVCDHCRNFHERIMPTWRLGQGREAELAALVERIKRDGRGKQYDCLIGISGGIDSSYLTYVAKEKLGLRPLSFHVDAGWNSQQAVGNIEKLTDALGLDLHTEVIDWREMQDLQLAFLKAQVAYADLPQDLAFFSSMYRFGVQNDFKYILTGGNFSTECVRQPLDWAYWGTDLRYIRDIHRRFGTRPLKSFPMSSIFRYKIFYRFFRGLKVARPLDYMPFVKADAVRELSEKFGWQAYAHKHHESRCTKFIESYWMPEKFGFDNRRAHFSSVVLTGQMTRSEALERVAKKGYDETELRNDIEYFATKLGISVDEFHAIVAGENRSWRDYRNRHWLIQMGNRTLYSLGVQKVLIRA
jgi:N-acetyl sugar amidotransferase